MPTPIQIQATKLEIPYSLSQLDNKKNEIAALVESLSLTFEGEQLLYATLVDLGIEQTKEGEQYDSIDVSRSAGVAPVTLKVTEHPVVGLSVDTTTGNAIIAVEPSSELSVTVEPARQIDVINEQPLIVSLTNKNVVSPSGGGTGSVASLKVGDDFNEGLTDELKAVTDTEGNESKLRLSKGKTEIQDSAIVRASTNPTMRLIADNADNPSTGEDMGTVRFTRNFEDPLALDLARAIFADFSERVVADGGTVEGSEECVASELELIVSGEYLINMVDIRPEYTGTLGSTKADLVFYLNDGTGSPIERFRINTDGDIEVKDPSKGIILRSENNTAYRIVVGNTGALAAIPPSSFKPSITTLPTISGTLNVGETLTATAGNVSGDPTPIQVLQWQRSDNGTTGWADIAGATGTTYLLGFNDEDKYIRVQQTEENILGTATANSASTTQIQPTAFVYLLDDYGGATEAYSLRRLSSTYTGYAIKVRRDSDQALQDIGFDSLTNGLDISSLESFCSGTDGFVHTWYDQSGNGNNATQTIASAQPKIVSNGSTITQNGKPIIKADASYNHFHMNVSGQNNPNTIRSQFAVTYLGVQNVENFRSIMSTINDGGDRYLFAADSGSTSNPFAGSARDLYLNGASVSIGNRDKMYNDMQGQKSSFIVSTSLVANNKLVNIGWVAQGWNMYSTQEIIFYPTDEINNRQGVETNINDFYSIY